MPTSTIRGVPIRFLFVSRLSDSLLGVVKRGLCCPASHIPGQQNLVADFLSRGKFLPSEWSLHPSVFLQIRQVHPPLAVDLFASSLAHLLPCYCARADDPDAWALDAFSIPWSDFLGYAFPPFALLPRVLEKVASDRASLLLIAPFWPKRPWFPRLQSLLAGQPRSLPVFRAFYVSHFSDSAPQSRGSTSYTLAALRSAGREAGLSVRAAELAASHLRPSSRATYDSRFGSFVKWCSTRQIDPYHAPLRAVADFLIHLFDDKKALSTIASHRTAIGTMHSGFPDGSSVSSSVHLSRLLRSFFLSRPPERTLVPPWSLHAVLRALAKPPFEPLAQASFLHLTVKTVFMVAVASGQRRSTLHALTLEPGHIRWNPPGFV